MYKKILIANDGSPGAAKALAVAFDLATRLKAELHMIAVEELPHFPTTIDELVEEKLDADHRYKSVVDRALQEAKARQLKLEVHLITGHPVVTIAEFIEQEFFDLLVIGFMGHSALYHRLVGSTTDRLVELAHCSVLVIK